MDSKTENQISHFANELFKSTCRRTPTNNEMKFIERLRTEPFTLDSNINVSSQYVRVLCQNNPNAKEFESLHKQLFQSNLKELDPYIGLLSIIKKNTEITTLLKSTYNGPDLDYQLRPQVLRNVIKGFDNNSLQHGLKDGKSGKAFSIPQSASSTTLNKYVTLDFLEPTLIPQVRAPFLLSDFDQVSQERALLRDLLSSLMGNNGIYIRPQSLDGTLQRKFEIDLSMHPGSLDIVKSIVDVCSDLSIISRFIYEYSEYEYGTVNQALASALNVQLKDIHVFICQMQDMFLDGELRLATLHTLLTEPSVKIKLMARLCSDIQSVKSRGGVVLSYFYHQKLSAVGECKNLLDHLMKCASIPLFYILKLWIYRGIICDPFDEFFISENAKWKATTGITEPNVISSDYWQSHYIIQKTLVPRFLEMYVERILNTGKYLNVIQLCGGDTEFPAIKEMKYETDENYYIQQIEISHKHASKLLLDIMFNQKKLKDYLRFMKHYFLLGEADWLSHFMFLAKDELNLKIAECSKIRLESLLDVTVQAGCSLNDSLKDNLRIELSDEELMPFIINVSAFNPLSKEKINKKILPGKNLCVLEALSLNIVTEWPISLVLNFNVVQMYQILFRHLFYCHYVKGVLSNVWLTNKCSNTRSRKNFRLISKANVLGNSMRIFIENLLYYMTTEIIEPLWIDFETKLDKAQNLDDIFKMHGDFLDACVYNCMVTTTSLLKTLHKMMFLCVSYANRFNRLFNNDSLEQGDLFSSKKASSTDKSDDSYDPEEFEKMIDDNSKTFNDLMKQLLEEIKAEVNNKRLLSLVTRLEYNGFYFRYDSGSDVE